MISVTAPAKLNLSLHITGKRMDGYHLLESLVAFTQFGDELTIEPADELLLSVSGEFASVLPAASPDNLVMKAALALQRLCGTSQGAHITLIKNLPVGSGMGGGSSDAAAVLQGLLRLWNIKPDRKQFEMLCLSLGSDVPMCMAGGAAFVRGVGDDISSVVLAADVHVLLVHPREPLLTADVYRAFSSPFSASVSMPMRINSFAQLISLISPMHNVLEQPAKKLMPQIESIVQNIAAQDGCAFARMSGSGAGCFGLFESRQAAEAAKASITRLQPRWWCAATQLERVE